MNERAQKMLQICNEDLCHRTIGLHATSINNEGAVIELPLKDEHMNFEKCVHGGILSLLLDTVMGFCVYPHLEDEEMILAIDLKVSYLKAATPEMKTVKAHGSIVSRTRRLAVSEGEILAPNGDILSKGMGTYAILKKSAAIDNKT